MSYKFEFYRYIDGKKERFEAETIELVCEDGTSFELHPRRSDGDVTLSSRGLNVWPLAANCVRIFGEKVKK